MVKSLSTKASIVDNSAPAKRASPPTASRALTTVLVRRVLAGAYPAGEKLPAEREMSEEFGVSRHVVREALKRLEAIGIIRIQHGSGVYTNDIVLTGGIELFEYLLFNEQGELDLGVLRDLFAFVVDFVPEVFRLAAVERTEEEIRALRDILTERAKTLDDLNRLIENSRRLLQVIARATHNSIYQLIFNNVGRIVVKLRERAPLTALAPLVPLKHLERIVEAIDNRDPEMAALLVLRQIELAQDTVARFLRSMGGAPGSIAQAENARG